MEMIKNEYLVIKFKITVRYAAIKSNTAGFVRAKVADKYLDGKTIILTYPDDGNVSIIVEPSMKLEWALTA